MSDPSEPPPTTPHGDEDYESDAPPQSPPLSANHQAVDVSYLGDQEEDTESEGDGRGDTDTEEENEREVDERIEGDGGEGDDHEGEGEPSGGAHPPPEAFRHPGGGEGEADDDDEDDGDNLDEERQAEDLEDDDVESAAERQRVLTWRTNVESDLVSMCHDLRNLCCGPQTIITSSVPGGVGRASVRASVGGAVSGSGGQQGGGVPVQKTLTSSQTRLAVDTSEMRVVIEIRRFLAEVEYNPSNERDYTAESVLLSPRYMIIRSALLTSWAIAARQRDFQILETLLYIMYRALSLPDPDWRSNQDDKTLANHEELLQNGKATLMTQTSFWSDLSKLYSKWDDEDKLNCISSENAQILSDLETELESAEAERETDRTQRRDGEEAEGRDGAENASDGDTPHGNRLRRSRKQIREEMRKRINDIQKQIEAIKTK
eukprot:GHVN01035670.1.p1 GENE.GHVN01035670.1~~GHVN01035670.1.p1  ORF type:complete len:432 (+),score=121.65 GHVN01035670.1:659-1954(+)